MNLREAVREAVREADRWVGGSCVVSWGDDEYEAIPVATLGDISYQGSREVVISLANGLIDSTGYSLEDATAEDIADLLL